ncbi:bifunctional acetaldehyde-CoA/alcohol dehydrogenase [Spirochaeta africana]|uniref:Aldehyde-alcohol dehydrogenase n=1 Tax=Spirochaeta africana (strain ATCC 700263 / DSM 8902 / Z-7692) TaxID=889378 RepID=H9ULT9_SPIAZ|nr:bifunctional acetaldehyde-CoA/alcohol dehydrogenase [Spirochaeta africana]AFG38482.1 alcohol dehydrogenase, class IV [Spirochaeta africana DSM 8902]
MAETAKQNTQEMTAAEVCDQVIRRVAAAQKQYAEYSQEQVDIIFRKAAMAANLQRIPLAQMTVEETGMGILEDKVIKNHFAAEYVYNTYKNTQTCGVVERDTTNGITRILEPVGVIAGVIPTTNPTSTAIFKTLLALKTRNGIVLSPHPRAKRATVAAARTVLEAAVAAGAPKDIIGWIAEPSIEATNTLMQHPETSLILATGGPGMVKAAYSSGKPAIGVGAGNTPAVIDETVELPMAISSILMSKTFDNGMICASEQSVVAVDQVYDAVKAEFIKRGAYIVNAKEKAKLAAYAFPNGKLNGEVVGQSAFTIAMNAGFGVDPHTKVLIAECDTVGHDEPLSNEKLSPILALYRAADYAGAVDRAVDLVAFGGLGHTSSLYTNEQNRDRIELFGEKMKTGRILVNSPASQGAIGDLYNFKLAPSLTLGCGSWGGNSVSENVGVKQLLNTKTIAEKRENMLWFQVPPKVYFKYGSMGLALRELQGKERAVIVTDRPLYNLGYADKVTRVLDQIGVRSRVFADVDPNPTLSNVKQGLAVMEEFQPDVIISLGGGSPIDAAKIMWLLYEDGGATFEGLAMRFMDIRKRIYDYPEMGKKAMMVAIPTTSGTGAEVTPFAVITDDDGMKHPLADYALTPDMAIIDGELVMSMPKKLTAWSGLDALTHAMEAYVSILSNEYTSGMALQAIKMVIENLPAAYLNGDTDVKAREKMHNASTIAGMAFANAFLGICHSLAHKLGARFHVPHGCANAMLLNHVIKFNATDVPTKQGTFAQYTHPMAKQRYAEIADYLGLGGKSEDEKVERLINKIEEIKQICEIPANLGEYGLDKAEYEAALDTMALEAFDDQCTGANPRYPLVEELKQIYLDAFERSC